MQGFIKIACSRYATFAIDFNGKPYSWGKGHIGHAEASMEAAPKKIVKNTDNRIFTNIYANNETVLFYAPIRVYNIYPKCGPRKGGT